MSGHWGYQGRLGLSGSVGDVRGVLGGWQGVKVLRGQQGYVASGAPKGCRVSGGIWAIREIGAVRGCRRCQRYIGMLAGSEGTQRPAGV